MTGILRVKKKNARTPKEGKDFKANVKILINTPAHHFRSHTNRKKHSPTLPEISSLPKKSKKSVTLSRTATLRRTPPKKTPSGARRPEDRRRVPIKQTEGTHRWMNPHRHTPTRCHAHMHTCTHTHTRSHAHPHTPGDGGGVFLKIKH